AARRLDALLARALDPVARARRRIARHAGAAGAALPAVAHEAVLAVGVAGAGDRRAADARDAHRPGPAARRVGHGLAAPRRLHAAVVGAVDPVVAADRRARHAGAAHAALLAVAEEAVGAGLV